MFRRSPSHPNGLWLVLGFERVWAGRAADTAPVRHHRCRALCRCGLWRWQAEGRRFPKLAFPLKQRGLQAFRRVLEALSLQRIRRVDGCSRASSLLERESIEKLRDLVTDLAAHQGTRGVLSLFSARQPPENGHLPGRFSRRTFPRVPQYDALIQKVLSNEIIRGKLLSEDGKLALIVIALDPAVANGEGDSKVISDIRKAAAEDMEGTGLKVELSGVPVMRLEIRNAVERDELALQQHRLCRGLPDCHRLLPAHFFHDYRGRAAPDCNPAWRSARSGWLDFRLNTFLNVMTPLIMVISFSDSMQLTFAARDRLIWGESKRDAFRNAIYVVGPACVLTHATAAISFVALLFSGSEMIQNFAAAGIISTVIALFTVITLLPLLGRFAGQA